MRTKVMGRGGEGATGWVSVSIRVLRPFVPSLPRPSVLQSFNPSIHQSINPSVLQSLSPSIHQSFSPFALPFVAKFRDIGGVYIPRILSGVIQIQPLRGFRRFKYLFWINSFFNKRLVIGLLLWFSICSSISCCSKVGNNDLL
jgi:hypothetical protein